MIRDVAEFRRTGVAGRRVAELAVPVEVWRTAMCHVARQDGARVRTFVVPSTGARPDERDGMVFAVRVDPPPARLGERNPQVRWWRVDELDMPFDRWRAVLHRVARREAARVKTFLGPARGPDQLVYVVWTDADQAAQAAAPRPSDGTPRPVTDLARYAAARRAATVGRSDVDGRAR